MATKPDAINHLNALIEAYPDEAEHLAEAILAIDIPHENEEHDPDVLTPEQELIYRNAVAHVEPPKPGRKRR